MELQVINTQTPMPQRVSDPDRIDTEGEPWVTIQGEGPFAGQPAVFVRLHGCNLKCKFCDTTYTSDLREVSADALVARVVPLANTISPKRKRLVVITGGEPFRQPLKELLVKLAGHGLRVQIETNGSLWDADYPTWLDGMVTIVVSPKLEVRREVWQYAKYAKYVLRHDKIGPDGLPTEVLGYKVAPDRPPGGWIGQIYVQPEDDQDPVANSLNQAACVQSALRFGYTVSLQTHKLLGLP